MEGIPQSQSPLPARRQPTCHCPSDKSDDRLLFSTCRSCALQYPNGARLDNYSCNHTNAQREFIWTGTSIELAQSLEEGYTVTEVYSALEYTEWSNDVFAGYVAD